MIRQTKNIRFYLQNANGYSIFALPNRCELTASINIRTSHGRILVSYLLCVVTAVWRLKGYVLSSYIIKLLSNKCQTATKVEFRHKVPRPPYRPRNGRISTALRVLSHVRLLLRNSTAPRCRSSRAGAPMSSTAARRRYARYVASSRPWSRFTSTARVPGKESSYDAGRNAGCYAVSRRRGIRMDVFFPGTLPPHGSVVEPGIRGVRMRRM